MKKLLVLSRDASQYRDLIEHAMPENVRLVQAVENPQHFLQYSDVEILLGDPDLCAPILPFCTNLQWMQSTWAGVKPVFDQSNKGFVLSGVKDIFGQQMKEYVLAHMLYFTRRIGDFQNLASRKTWTPVRCETLAGKTMGLLGVGSIGKEVAKTAKQFGMKIIGFSRLSQNSEDVDSYASLDQLADIAPQIDFLVSLLPHTKDTENCIDQDVLDSLPKHCVLINAGRAQVVDERALVKSLQHRKIKAAVLDVFHHEPLEMDSPLWTLDNILITQHTAAISVPTNIAKLFLHNCQLFSEGKKCQFEIDWHRGY